MKLNEFTKDIEVKNKRIDEANKMEMHVVYVTSNYSVTKVINQKNYDKIDKVEKEVDKEMKTKAHTDDWWIDDVWMEGSMLKVNWKNLATKGGKTSRLDQESVDLIFEDDEFVIKSEFLDNQGYDITPENLEEVQIYDAGSETRIEGNWKVFFPEDWLYDNAEEMGVDKIILDNWTYFKEGYARMVSDDEPNGSAHYDFIGDYFVWTYNT